MKTSQWREIKRLNRMKERLASSRIIRAELRITSRTTQGEYRLLFKRRSLYEPGDFYLASAGKQIRLSDVLLFQLLKNIQRGNYAVRSSLTISQGSSSREQIHIYSNQPFKPKGEGTNG